MITLELISTPSAVAAEAGIALDRLRGLIESKAELFRPIQMKKRRPGAGFRTVYEVHESLSPFHRKVALWVEWSWDPLECVHGFRKGRSIVSHAKRHCGRDVVVTADIMDFFPSIKQAAVHAAFKHLGASDQVADMLTDAAVLDGALPAGTRCSPILANVVCRDLDIELSRTFPNYTRYADDLAFSGQAGEVPSEHELRSILTSHGFELREGSYFSVAKPRKRRVTGLLVDHEHGPHVDRELKRRLRQEVYYILRYGLEDHCDHVGERDEIERISYLRGKLSQVAMVEPEFAFPLLRSLPLPSGYEFPEPDYNPYEDD